MKNLTKSILALTLLLLISCNKNECNNNNPIFDNALPESAPYIAELAKVLQHEGNATQFYFDKLEDNDSVRLLYVDVIGDSLCAKAMLTVRKQDDKLDGIIKANGKGYSGAGLQDLKFDIVQDSAATVLIYESVGKIVD
ncbi:MAG: hypothetical protein PSV16_04535 [Flavobacterium sp.]|nr:hypothetical protein [Flavobacterium sp.]